jgi:hypothetical protein
MAYPHSIDDVPLDNCNLAVVAFHGDIRSMANFFIKTVIRAGQPYLTADFDVANPTMCRSLSLFMPVTDGMLISNVEPCIVRPGLPMILVTKDRKRAFVIRDGRLVECKVPRPARITHGIAHGWAELIRRMNAAVTADGAFRHASCEVHLSPFAAAAVMN